METFSQVKPILRAVCASLVLIKPWPFRRGSYRLPLLRVWQTAELPRHPSFVCLLILFLSHDDLACCTEALVFSLLDGRIRHNGNMFALDKSLFLLFLSRIFYFLTHHKLLNAELICIRRSGYTNVV